MVQANDNFSERGNGNRYYYGNENNVERTQPMKEEEQSGIKKKDGKSSNLNNQEKDGKLQTRSREGGVIGRGRGDGRGEGRGRNALVGGRGKHRNQSQHVMAEGRGRGEGRGGGQHYHGRRSGNESGNHRIQHANGYGNESNEQPLFKGAELPDKKEEISNNSNNDRRGGGSHRGNGQGRGRGQGRERGRESGQQRGRGNETNANYKRGETNNGDKSHNKSQPQIKIESSHFQTRFHNAICKAAKYKAHAPNCSCSKVKTLREKYHHSRRSKSVADTQGKSGEDEGAHLDVVAIEGADQSGDVDISRQLGEMHISPDDNSRFKNNSTKTKYYNASEISTMYDVDDDPFSNIIVVPDTKSPFAIYSCRNTDAVRFQEDGIACEKKLSDEIFFPVNNVQQHSEECEGEGVHDGASSSSSPSSIQKIMPFKVTCALCLLSTLQPNGFLAVSSSSPSKLHATIQHARNATQHKLENGQLHSDHAHFVSAVDVSLLQSLLRAGKTRNKNQRVVMDILSQIREGGVDLPADLFESEPQSASNSLTINLGHHLTSLLWLLQKQKQSRSNNKSNRNNHHNPHNVTPNLSSSEDKRTHHYIMVLGYQDTPMEWTLDLPGGKRHLGETTLEGLLREVEEECSLQMEKEWLTERMPVEYGGKYGVNSNASIDVLSGERDVVQILDSGDDSRHHGNVYILMSSPRFT